jgi:hypothetical protein
VGEERKGRWSPPLPSLRPHGHPVATRAVVRRGDGVGGGDGSRGPPESPQEE